MKHLVRNSLIMFSVVLSMGSPASAGDITAGQTKAAICAACHGANGVSLLPNYPNLAGQKEQYLVTEMKEIKNGQRSAICGPIMAPLGDNDIENLAAYYASL